MLKQSLSQKMLQKLSPQQIQLMKLLQVPTVMLDQRIKEELEANPALEEGAEQDELADIDKNNNEELAEDSLPEPDADDMREDQYELDDYLNDYIEDDPSSYKLRANNYSTEEEDKNIPIPVESTFHDHLERQLGLMEFRDEKEEAIAHQVIGSIDDDGYLRREPAAIMDDLMFSQNVFVSEEEILHVLKRIQRLDPPGIGARGLQECLLLQLYIKRDQEELEDMSLEEWDSLVLAIDILENHFDEFTKKHYQKLQTRLNITEEGLKGAIDEIIKLNPKPASGYSSNSDRSIQYIIPDFIIVNREGELELTLNSRNAPDLRVNDQYRDMLRAYKRNTQGRRANKKEREAVMFIKQKIDSAKWFIDAIRQRQDTMYRAMYAILQYQYDFFLTGDTKKLRPMILKDIADITGLDISTVSRVANSKFVQTEFGTKRLKEFFSESLSTQEGEEVSTLEVKKILEEVIAQENKRKPLSDQKLQKALEDKGYNIARRTVAKYREQLNIPVARLRKEL
ncbi:MAG: RNA polymerase factor sigma-54 [Lewinellaceae bacterium]|nr:RNA polymerase factor sigma-54 [Phaeodactylibacter sp.]MCB9037547.1 RNA polymerase factor sigma-54 [Lewinellaceae bacterium]